MEFDSYILPSRDLRIDSFRVLEVDNQTILPYKAQLRILITSSDVIHSWAVPRLGVKVDAVPGRLNQLRFFVNRPGIFFGQCSEICGANHRFIPIVLEVITLEGFLNWLKG